MTDDRMQFMTIVLDGPTMGEHLAPWILVLLSAIPAVRCLFLPRHANPERAQRTARRCYSALHVLSTAVLVYCGTLALVYGHAAGLFQDVTALVAFHLTCIHMAHALRPVMFGLFVAQMSAVVVALRTGIQPRLWQPRGFLVSMFFCALAQAGVLWMITAMMQP